MFSFHSCSLKGIHISCVSNALKLLSSKSLLTLPQLEFFVLSWWTNSSQFNNGAVSAHENHEVDEAWIHFLKWFMEHLVSLCAHRGFALRLLCVTTYLSTPPPASLDFCLLYQWVCKQFQIPHLHTKPSRERRKKIYFSESLASISSHSIVSACVLVCAGIHLSHWPGALEYGDWLMPVMAHL